MIDREIAKRKLQDAKLELKRQKALYDKHKQFQLNNPAELEKHYKGKLDYHKDLIDHNQASVDELKKNWSH